MRPDQGPSKKFVAANEDEMAEYCCFCWEIGIPKSKHRFGHELVHYIEFYGLKNKFSKTEPGNESLHQ